MTTYAVIGHPKREEHYVKDKNSGVNYSFYTDPAREKGYSASNQDPFIWYKNWMYSFCHAHNFINKFYYDNNGEKSKSGLDDEETYFVFVAPQDKNREKFIVDTIIKAKQIIKIDRKLKNKNIENNENLIKLDKVDYFIKKNCKDLAEDMFSKIDKNFHISNLDIENIILKYHYPAFVRKVDNSKVTRYEKLKSDNGVNSQGLSNDMYLGPVHNSKGVNDLYLVIGDPEESFIPLIRNKKTGEFKNLIINNSKDDEGHTLLQNIGVQSKSDKNMAFYPKVIKSLKQLNLKDDFSFTEMNLTETIYKKTSNEFVEDVFGDKDYFDNIKKFDDREYCRKIMNTKIGED